MPFTGGDSSGRDPRSRRSCLRNPQLAEDAYFACAAGDAEAVRAAIAGDAEFVRTPGGPLKMPPLCAVTFSALVRVPEAAGRFEHCARLLLDAGADPDSSWRDPEWDVSLSALYGAAGMNHSAALTKMLLVWGADPNDGESLYHSLEGENLDCTRLLLAGGARVTGCNALFRSLDFNKLDALRLLLQNGGEANEESGELGRPLHHALKRLRSMAHIQMLLDAGADPAAPNPQGQTPYRLALRGGLTEMAALLLERSPDEAPLSVRERLVAACAAADENAARALLSAHPGLIDRLSETQLRTLPDLAAAGGWEAVRVMIEVGADRCGGWRLGGERVESCGISRRAGHGEMAARPRARIGGCGTDTATT